MATLGTELGCERYLASTVVTGSGQRSSTFLAKLRRNGVFVLALRAFHCRPRRKKRARCTARVTSHMIGDKADVLGLTNRARPSSRSHLELSAVELVRALRTVPPPRRFWGYSRSKIGGATGAWRYVCSPPGRRTVNTEPLPGSLVTDVTPHHARELARDDKPKSGSKQVAKIILKATASRCLRGLCRRRQARNYFRFPLNHLRSLTGSPRDHFLNHRNGLI